MFFVCNVNLGVIMHFLMSLFVTSVVVFSMSLLGLIVGFLVNKIADFCDDKNLNEETIMVVFSGLLLFTVVFLLVYNKGV